MINKKDVESIHPPNVGWLEYKLTNQQMDYVWKCIENKKEGVKHNLAGNITGSYLLKDRGDWFWGNVLSPLRELYIETFDNRGEIYPLNQQHPCYLQHWWVNYQKQTEFNPLHNHSGVYSFVIWMKIPTDYEEQEKNPIASQTRSDDISNFQVQYVTIMGEPRSFTYRMSPKVEGVMLFFPSKLSHTVYPFYNCDEDRISVSGNILINTARRL
jgi:hypothetical protein